MSPKKKSSPNKKKKQKEEQEKEEEEASKPKLNRQELIKACYDIFTEYENDSERPAEGKIRGDERTVQQTKKWKLAVNKINTIFKQNEKNLPVQYDPTGIMPKEAIKDFFAKHNYHGHYETRETIETKLQALLLFLRVDESGIAYGPPCNLRVATALKPKKNYAESEPLMCMFYETSIALPANYPGIYGIGLESSDQDAQSVVRVKIDGLTAKPVSQGAFDRLCFLLCVKPKPVIPPRDEPNSCHGFHDFHSILDRYPNNGVSTDIFRSMDTFNLFVKTLDWEAYKIEESKGLAHNILRLRWFLNMISPIGMVCVDGNNRLFSAHKTFMGKVAIKKKSPVLYSYNMSVIMPMFYDSEQITTAELRLTAMQTRDQKKMEEKQGEKNWQAWMRGTLDEIGTRPHAGFSILTYSKIKVRCRFDLEKPDEFEENINDVQVAVGKQLICVDPPHSLATAIPKNKKGSFEPYKFLDKYINSKKDSGYRMNHFHKKQSKMGLDFTRLRIYPYWKDYQIAVMLEFMVLLCTFTEGRKSLRSLLSCNDPRLCEPSWIAQFVLVPVSIITDECVNMIRKEQCALNVSNKKYKIWDSQKQVYKSKLRLLLKFWYLKRYVDAMVHYIKNHDAAKWKQKFTDNQYKELLGDDPRAIKDLQDLKDLAVFLLLMPTEFERWHDEYNDDCYKGTMQDEIQNQQELSNPFDVTLPMNRSFVYCIKSTYYGDNRDYPQVCNHTSWDPLGIVKHLMITPAEKFPWYQKPYQRAQYVKIGKDKVVIPEEDKFSDNSGSNSSKRKPPPRSEHLAKRQKKGKSDDPSSSNVSSTSKKQQYKKPPKDDNDKKMPTKNKSTPPKNVSENEGSHQSDSEEEEEESSESNSNNSSHSKDKHGVTTQDSYSDDKNIQDSPKTNSPSKLSSPLNVTPSTDERKPEKQIASMLIELTVSNRTEGSLQEAVVSMNQLLEEYVKPKTVKNPITVEVIQYFINQASAD